MPDLSQYTLAWSDEFSFLSVANTTTATANWYLQQPWGGAFSNADMVNNPERLAIVNKAGESALEISMVRNAAGTLESAIISTEFPDGTSAAPQDGDPYGYYEMRAWLPDPNSGIWPAFWGIEAERWQETTTRDHVIELDVLEHYGSAMPDRYTSVIHDWNWGGTALEGHASSYIRKVPGHNVMNTGWHTYGVEITPEDVTFYFDNKEYWSVAMDATNSFDQTFGQMIDTELGWMINLAAGGGWPIDPALGTSAMPANMYVDYFRMYEKDGTTPPDGPPQVAFSVSDPTVAEGGQLSYTVSLNQASTVTTSVNYATGGGTAAVGSDYTAIGGTLVFAAGETAKTVFVSTIDDATDEANKTVNLVLSGVAGQNATIADALGIGTITDNDDPPVGGPNEITGTASGETLIGTAAADIIRGLAGIDNLYGRAGDDVLVGGDRNRFREPRG